jgi:phage terminase large subunit-like protein
MATTPTSDSSAAQRFERLLRPDQVAGEWRRILSLVPGYNPFKTAGDARFDPEAAAAACDFFERHLKHVEGALAGQPFRLEDWQKAVVANLFGWKRLDRKARLVRRYRECLVYVPRKNGKTPLVAGLALLVLFADGEAGQQDYIGAGDREQAGMLFRQAKGMVEQSPQLRNRCDVFGGSSAAGQAKSIVKKGDGSFLRVISADADTKHGGNTHLGVIDELHVQPDRELVDVMQTSTASENRKSPLLVWITTADFCRPSICNEKHDYACKVRDGVVDDPSFLPVVYEAGRDEPWDDEAVWRKANPNLGVSVSLDYLRRECGRAKETPAYENTFRRLHLNQKTETDVRAVPMDRWDDCGKLPVVPSELEGRQCWAGLDLSTTTDLSALALVFPGEGREPWQALWWFWVPRESARLRSRRDRVPYEAWIAAGLIKATDGDVIDYDVVRQDVNDLAKAFNIRQVAADRWNATQLMTQLAGDGLDVVAFGQGFQSMTAPTKELLALVTAGRLAHGGNPIARWMASNLATETDAAGNLKPSKKKSTERIDAMVALIMGIGVALIRPVEEDDWYSRGALLS